MEITAIITYPNGDTRTEAHELPNSSVQAQAALVAQIRREHPRAETVKIALFPVR